MLSVFSENFGMNVAKYWMAPRKDINVLWFLVCSYLFIAFVFLLGLIPPCVLVCPSHIVSFWKNYDFFLLALSPLFSSFVSTEYNFRVCFVPGLQ